MKESFANSTWKYLFWYYVKVFCHILTKYPLCKIFSLENCKAVSYHFNKGRFSLDNVSTISIPPIFSAAGDK